MATIPKTPQNFYNRNKMGIYGNLGQGANADIIFIQTTITRDDLDSITLIKNIPGSEQWDIRDLFQRDVDDVRVEKEIIPYFKDNKKVKYFSPITLILLPMDEESNIIKHIDFIKPIDHKSGEVVKSIERKNYYKIDFYDDSTPFAKIEWNDRKCFLVAIDGQHRLSALHRWKKEVRSSFSDWKIPVVILNILKVDEKKESVNLLEIVRNTFVYINSKSERINPAREILLNDESVNAICTQELIQDAHSNDLKEINKRNIQKVPLVFFDWQSRVVDKQTIEGPASLKSVEEINSWFKEYLLEEDGGKVQKYELCLKDKLKNFGKDSLISHSEAPVIRSQFRELLLPGLNYFLENFKPYKDYIRDCRDLERAALQKSDNAVHAFMKLRFGSHNAPEDQITAINNEYEELKTRFKEFRDKDIPKTLQHDIGMRSIIFAFSEIRKQIIALKGTPPDYLEFSKKFTSSINEIVAEGWFTNYQELNNKKRELLTALCFDEGGGIINYKLSASKDGLGSLMTILVAKKFTEKKIFSLNSDDYGLIWNEYSSNLKKSYEKIAKRILRSSEKMQGTMAEFNKLINNKAGAESEKKIKQLGKYIDTLK